VRLILAFECFVEALRALLALLALLCAERRGVRPLAIFAWPDDDRVRDGRDRLIPRAGRPFFTPPLSGPNGGPAGIS